MVTSNVKSGSAKILIGGNAVLKLKSSLNWHKLQNSEGRNLHTALQKQFLQAEFEATFSAMHISISIPDPAVVHSKYAFPTAKTHSLKSIMPHFAYFPPQLNDEVLSATQCLQSSDSSWQSLAQSPYWASAWRSVHTSSFEVDTGTHFPMHFCSVVEQWPKI